MRGFVFAVLYSSIFFGLVFAILMKGQLILSYD